MSAGEARDVVPVSTLFSLRKAIAVVRLGRPIFLLGGVALYGLGTLAAVRRGHAFELDAFVFGQLAVSAVQLMTHYANDYFDYEADKANRTPTRWSGGSRVLVNGELPRALALRVALLVALGVPAALAGLALSSGHFPVEVVVLVLSMQALAWSYSAPPLSLHSRGLGEVTTALVVPLLMPLAGFLVQSGSFDWFPLALAAPLALLQIVMLLSIEFPDSAGDRSAGKRTLVVLLGAARAARLATVLVVSAFALVALGVLAGMSTRLAWAWAAVAPLAVLHVARLARGDYRLPSAWESLAFGSVALYFLAIVAELLALA
ncbi:MAG TPA: prenyltransferase [Polyangiaceae bacterium]